MFGATKFDPRSDHAGYEWRFSKGLHLLDEIHQDEWGVPNITKWSRARWLTKSYYIYQRSTWKWNRYDRFSQWTGSGRQYKAFLGMRRTCGEADVIANMVADLQMVGFGWCSSF